MQRIYLIVILASLMPLLDLAQQLSKAGDVSKQEPALKECAFDKDADAIIFIDEATSNHDNFGQLITIHHVRLKILKEPGLDGANVFIPFYRKDKLQRLNFLNYLNILNQIFVLP